MVSGYLQFYPSNSVISYISKLMISKLNAINNIFLQHAVKDSRGSNNCNFSYVSHTQQKTSVAANITDLSCLFQNLHGPANGANIICREKSLFTVYISSFQSDPMCLRGLQSGAIQNNGGVVTWTTSGSTATIQMP